MIIRPGVAVDVYQDPVTRQRLEGKAEVVEILTVDTAAQMISAVVRFDFDHADETYTRHLFYGAVTS